MLSVLLPPERAGRIACRVTHTVKAFRHRAAVQVVPVVGRLSGLSARRSPAEAMRSVGLSVALNVKERWCFAVAVCRCDGLTIPPVFLVVNTAGHVFFRRHEKPAQRRVSDRMMKEEARH
jgi:hypothetical protein